jgi:DtxR family transcriptional regulator, Mn-dependent transcriptional regulator
VDAGARSQRRRAQRHGGVPAGVSDAAQDYLREIYKLQAESERVSTTALARRMRVTPPSASAMVKKLAALGLAEHALYRGARLTPAGERIALELLRHHRLLELYLAQTLEIGIDAVHSEADRLEHALSEELESRIDEALGRPTHDPHGDPIPSAQLKIERPTTKPLTALEPGEEAKVQSVPDGDGELLRYLVNISLVPGQTVTLLQVAPFNGPLTVRANGRETAISAELAAQITVAA